MLVIYFNYARTSQPFVMTVESPVPVVRRSGSGANKIQGAYILPEVVIMN